MKLAPLLPDLLGTSRIAVWATDEEKYIYFQDYAGFDTGMEVGTKMPEGDSAFIAMKENRAIERVVPKEVFGRELRSFVVPVDGGTLGITFDYDDTRQVTEAIQQINASEQEILSSSSSMAEYAADLSDWMNGIEQTAKEAIEQKGNIEKVVVTIREIVDTLGLLSLNSMIEAARAGEHGRTFMVVANEVKKLAVDGKENVEQITDVLKHITSMLETIYHEIEKINKKMEELSVTSKHIAASTEEIASSIQSLDHMAEKLR